MKTQNENGAQLPEQGVIVKKQWIKPEMAVLVINLDNGPVDDSDGREAS